MKTLEVRAHLNSFLQSFKNFYSKGQSQPVEFLPGWDHEVAAAMAGLPIPHDNLRPGPGACRRESSNGECLTGKRGTQRDGKRMSP